MKAIDALNRFSDVQIPAYQRNIVQKALSTLRVEHGGNIVTDKDTLYKIAARLNVTPTKWMNKMYIRIYDETDNGVDITATDMQATLCGHLKKAMA